MEKEQFLDGNGIKAWEEARNASGNGVNWQFTADDARIKLKKLYPKV